MTIKELFKEYSFADSNNEPIVDEHRFDTAVEKLAQDRDLWKRTAEHLMLRNQSFKAEIDNLHDEIHRLKMMITKDHIRKDISL